MPRREGSSKKYGSPNPTARYPRATAQNTASDCGSAQSMTMSTFGPRCSPATVSVSPIGFDGDGMVTHEEHDTRQRFADRDREDRTDAVRQIEQAVIGGDWGANGYTTIRQADHLAAILRLAPGQWVLDLGAGHGWPGLYLALRTGCQVVLTDVPLEGLRLAIACRPAKLL